MCACLCDPLSQLTDGMRPAQEVRRRWWGGGSGEDGAGGGGGCGIGGGVVVLFVLLALRRKPDRAPLCLAGVYESDGGLLPPAGHLQPLSPSQCGLQERRPAAGGRTLRLAVVAGQEAARHHFLCWPHPICQPAQEVTHKNTHIHTLTHAHIVTLVPVTRTKH